MFIQTEATTDPARLKFLPGREVLAEGVLELRDRAEAAASPLAERLFALPEVAGVAFGRDCIIVTKADGDWLHLKPAILGAIMEHYMSGAPVLSGRAAGHGETSPARPADETRQDIWEALRQVIDPELGYNIVDLGLVYDVVIDDARSVRIAMTTTTQGCPATNYLKKGAGDSASEVPGVEFVEVTLTYDPPWTPEMMSPEAKEHFGIRDGGGW